MHKYKASYIRGEFEGWNSDSLYELEDGSQWKLASDIFNEFYRYRPKVLLWRDGDKFFLQVQNMSDKQEVIQVG